MTTVDISSKEFYGEGYEDSDRRIPDMKLVTTELGKCHFRLNTIKYSALWDLTFFLLV